ncbi:MAG: restriction endonuclease subunit R [Candidatus Rokubacteria bacterium GWA2_70_23]|nr:MAG: restriction endonuclease subunit R [Candidatus Rokubacteria bacterium GWA2_70_23]
MTPAGSGGPEQIARKRIDEALSAAGWILQDRDQMDVQAARGVAVREFRLAPGHGYADYMLFVDGKAVGVLEAKPAGHTLIGVEPQAERYAQGLPRELSPPVRPLPFLYLSTGEITRFTNLLDPDPRSRHVFQVHRPETIAEWLLAETLADWVRGGAQHRTAAEPAVVGMPYTDKPSSLRARLRHMPPAESPGLWPNQSRALANLEQSLRDDRPRALIQMATGSGKTLLAVASIYRLIKLGGARRVLFLVDRGNLGEQAEDEFAAYRAPDDARKFTELYTVQRLASNTIAASAKVVICTIQRMYSILKGEPDLPPDAEEGSQFGPAGQLPKEPVPVVYNAAISPEYFDVIFIDECHRSIYSLWRQVLEYFDAYLVGLTATPAAHTFGFFHQNLVMEYTHEQAVADGVNVDFQVYRIRTRITEQGSTIEASEQPVLGIRDRRTRKLRWEAPDEDVTYAPDDLDRNVVARDQIRLIVRTFKEKLFTEIFPGRTEVPKTLIFAKDDSHAEDIVEIIREEFGRGNDFCQKITYRTTGKKPADLIQEFRISYHPRIAVTVDMVATGTDIRPVEIVAFMRAVQSRVLFEQMKGRGVRVIDADELKGVTPDAQAKTHFVIVDCVGLTETGLSDTQPLERKRHVSFKALLEHVAAGGTDPDMLSSLASRLARLGRQCSPDDEHLIREKSGGISLAAINHAIVDALDPDSQADAARKAFDLADDAEPTAAQMKAAADALLKQAVAPLATRPTLRTLLEDLKRKFEQIIDEVSKDSLLEAGHSEEARQKARTLVTSFEQWIAGHRDEIDALQVFYSQPYGRRLRFTDIKALAEAIKAPPRSWTPDLLWRAYEILERDKVRGASGKRLLTDIVSLVRFAIHRQDELVPYADRVRERFGQWLGQQAGQGRHFTAEQARWLDMIRDHLATSVEIDTDDFSYTPFAEAGGLGRARDVFGDTLRPLLNELNEVLAA